MHRSQISRYFDILGKCQKAYARQLEPLCRKWEMTRSEMDVLLFLYNNPQYDRAADIVSHRGMAKSHVSLSVTNLEQRELLVRTFSASDRRTAHLCLTDPGKAIAREGKELQEAFFAELYTGVKSEERILWEQIIEKIWDNVENFDKTETIL